MTAPPAGKRGPGRRPGESGTQQAILDAARTQFAAHGWDRATIRAIARDADVDPALVLHFFGSKAFLFAAAMRWPFDTEAAVEAVVSGPRSELGARLAAFFLSIWEDPRQREPLMTVFLGPLGTRLGASDAELRMSLCSAQLIGLGTARYIVGFEPLASLAPERVVELVGPALQRYMTEDL
jgi:AcrR family transcriptional regulator